LVINIYIIRNRQTQQIYRSLITGCPLYNSSGPVEFYRGHAVICDIYRVSQEECEVLRKSVPYVKLYRYNPKHLYPKLNGCGDNGQRKVWTSCISAYCTSTAVAH